MKIKFITHKFHPYKVHTLMFFLLCSEMCNHHHHLKTLLSPQKEALYPVVVTPILSPNIPQSLGTLIYFQSTDFPILGLSYKWNHIICDLLYYNNSEVKHMIALHSFFWLNKIPLHGANTFCLSIHQLIDIWGCSHFWTVMNNAAINVCILFCMDSMWFWTGYYRAVVGTYDRTWMESTY